MIVCLCARFFVVARACVKEREGEGESLGGRRGEDLIVRARACAFT